LQIVSMANFFIHREFLKISSNFLAFIFLLLITVGNAIGETGGDLGGVSLQAQKILLSNPKSISKGISHNLWENDEQSIHKSQIDWISSVDRLQMDGMHVTVITPKTYRATNSQSIAVYIHGGAYVGGVALDYTGINMAHKLGLKVYSIDYRLAPEHPFPAGMNDCVVVYRALLKKYDANQIVVFGRSAGGGMALATLLKARDLELPLPRPVALLSPWTDLTRTGDSYYSNAGRGLISWEGLSKAAEAYAGEYDRKMPFLSPIYADYKKGFPPTLISTGTRDLFLSNAARLQRVLKRAEIEVELTVWEGMWHAFDGFYFNGLSEAEESRHEIAEFLLSNLNK